MSRHENDSLAAARGVAHGLWVSFLLWAALAGFIALIYFNVHV